MYRSYHGFIQYDIWVPECQSFILILFSDNESSEVIYQSSCLFRNDHCVLYADASPCHVRRLHVAALSTSQNPLCINLYTNGIGK